MSFFLIWSSGGPFVKRSRTVCAILGENVMMNNSVNLFQIRASGTGGKVVKKYFLSGALPALCSVE